MLAPVMTMNEGGGIYSPGGRLLQEGDALRQPGLVAALSAVAEEGGRSAYGGTLGRSLIELMGERGGVLTERDLDGYRARWSDPVRVDHAGTRVLTRDDLSGVPATLARLPRFRGRPEPERALAWAEALASTTPDGGTTNITVVDRDGNACVLTTSLGLGSGDFLPGFDLHLNSMLGEAELVRGPVGPGERMGSMMAPSLAIDGEGLALAAGAAGGTRLRAALLQSVAAVLDEGLRPQAAVARPRLHRIGSAVHLEPGWGDDAVAALEAAGFSVKTWPAQHHYFGGVSLVARTGAAADPRRSGAVVLC
jgi:gamma-glutamyltranspeptidase/glutathione hydrolase